MKTAEVLTRDRLLGSITVSRLLLSWFLIMELALLCIIHQSSLLSVQVKPVLSRLKNTLVTLAAMLVACVLLFISLEREAMDSSRLSEAGGGGGEESSSHGNDGGGVLQQSMEWRGGEGERAVFTSLGLRHGKREIGNLWRRNLGGRI